MLAIILLAFLAVSSAEDRIHNGKAVPPDDLLNVVRLVMAFKNPDRTSTCTGTIISEHHVLTAAHCLHHEPDQPYALGVLTRDKNQPGFLADHWTIHSGYTYENYEDDIGIITVQQPMKIPPVNLAANYTQVKKDWLRVAGYGKTKYEFINGSVEYMDSAENLMETYVYGYNKESEFCDKLTAQYPDVNGICMHHPNKGTLPGDSGGPSFALGKDGKYYQVAITSFGDAEPNDGIWSLDTDVSYYCPWIEETTGGKVKCQSFKPTPIEPTF
uniref:Peptidase S1 domain-containing protein n=1 Tax=Panagrolaimus sp. JU765 TaxID=591449 RepID=A0AC34R4X1_9BILA